MGKWCKNLFGQETCGSVGIVITGTSRPEFEKEVLGLCDEVISSKDAVYHAHLVKKNGILLPIVFNIYGAPAMVDVLTEMYDGGCHTVLFLGVAYGGFKNLEVGSIVVPKQSYHFDGIYHALKVDKQAALPDQELKQKIEEIFTKEKIAYVEGTNISVPAVTFQLPHDNPDYLKIKPDTVEMELAACLSRAKEIGMRAAGVLVISDNRKTSLGDRTKRELRNASKMKVIKLYLEHLKALNLKPLKTEKKFSIDSHLASIIEDPNDKANVYRAAKT
ncbi:hypothetical protein HYS50_00280 [Candidatus Woesearchaeota archaeon]|nr:hypothetical protein [Candidatus Woesearchaeota archaeon]